MDKAYVEVEALVNLPVKVRIALTLRTDNDADIEKAVKKFSKGKRYKKADVEDSSIVHWTNFDIEEQLQKVIDNGKFEVEAVEVVDAK